MLDTERPDTWEVQGRGELQLAVLVEAMRREGFELTVGKPQVVTREVDGKLHEPIERLAIDVPEDYLGTVTQLLAPRKGADGEHGQPRHRLGADGVHGARPRADRLPHRVPDRDPRHRHHARHIFEGYEPWQGEIRTRATRLAGGRPAGRDGDVRAAHAAGARRSCSSAPASEVYEGMIVGENARADDLDVNAVAREEADQHARGAARTSTVQADPAARLSLDQALEFIREDECVEVTPGDGALRKLVLDSTERGKLVRARKRAS